MIIFSYILQHFLAILIIFTKKYDLRYYLSCSILFLSFIIFVLSNDTYDIISYTKSISSPSQFEFLFAKNLEIFKYFGFEKRNIIYIIQFEIFIIFCICSFLISKKNFVILLAILSVSIFYYLTIFNNLRQGISCVFIFFAFYFSKNKRFFLTLLMIIISQLFHKSSIFFISIFFLFFVFLDVRNKKNFYKINDLLKFSLILFPICAVSLAIYFVLSQYIDLPYYGYFLDTRDVHYSRTDMIVKTFSLLLIFAISEIVIDISIKIEKIKFDKFFNEFRFYRFVMMNLIIITYLFQLYDLQSRFMFFYWFLEILMCMKAIENKRFTFFTFIIILSYMFAINAIKQII